MRPDPFAPSSGFAPLHEPSASPMTAPNNTPDPLADTVAIAIGVLMHRYSLSRHEALERLHRMAAADGLLVKAEARAAARRGRIAGPPRQRVRRRVAGGAGDERPWWRVAPQPGGGGLLPDSARGRRSPVRAVPDSGCGCAAPPSRCTPAPI